MKFAINFDLATLAGQSEAHKDLQRLLREVQHAIVGLEVITIAHQAREGLLTTEEMISSIALKTRTPPQPLQVGDMDFLTGFKVKSREEFDAELDASYPRRGEEHGMED